MSVTAITLGIGMILIRLFAQMPATEELIVEDLSAGDTVPTSGGGTGEWIVKRVEGDAAAGVIVSGGMYRFQSMVVEASLPVDYPAPTPPAVIELKKYPKVRRAEFTQTGNPDRGRNRAFWPLFKHIKSRDIAMTSPVELDVEGWDAGTGFQIVDPRWTMSFLYRSPDLGPVGDDGSVRVTDAEPITVLSIGVRGAYTMDRLNAAAAELAAWLEQQDEWQIAGDVRALLYNGPYVASRNKWAEVQVPVVKLASEAVAMPERSEAHE
ncbi:MAG: heme-binding protein [Phycisphaerales bacterium]|nr:MAG: heme-binding protein [Phycisphaerales bacterium]